MLLSSVLGFVEELPAAQARLEGDQRPRQAF